MQGKPKTKVGYANLGKGFRKLGHSNSTDIFKPPMDEPPKDDRKPCHLYQSVLHQMQDDQSNYINSLLLNKRNSNANSSHLRVSSDFSQAKQIEMYDRYVSKAPPKERHTYNEFLHRESMISDQFPMHSELEIQSSTANKRQTASSEEYLNSVSHTASFLESIDMAILELSRKGQNSYDSRGQYRNSASLKESNLLLRRRLQQCEDKLKQMEMAIHFKAKKQATRQEIHKSKYQEMAQYISQLQQSLEKQRGQKLSLAKCLKSLQGKIDIIHQTNKQIKVKYDIGNCVKGISIDDDDDDEQPSERTGLQRYTVNQYYENKENIKRNRLKRNHSVNKGGMYM